MLSLQAQDYILTDYKSETLGMVELIKAQDICTYQNQFILPRRYIEDYM